jgi:hypothetical protein
VTHCNTIVDSNGVKFFGNPSSGFNFPSDQLTKIFQVNMTWDKLGKGINDSDNRFLKIVILHPCGAPQGTGTSHITASGSRFRAILGHSDLK